MLFRSQGEVSDISADGVALVVTGGSAGDVPAEAVKLTVRLPDSEDPVVVYGRIRERSLVSRGRRFGIAFDAESPESKAARASIGDYVLATQRSQATPKRRPERPRTIRSKISRAMWLVTLGFVALAVITTLHLSDRFAQKNISDRLHDAETRFSENSSARYRFLREWATSVAADVGLPERFAKAASDHEYAFELAKDVLDSTPADLAVLVGADGRTLANSGYPGTVRQPWDSDAGYFEGHDALFVTATHPVHAGGREVGRLVLGERVDVALAAEIRGVAHTDVLIIHRGKLVAGSWETGTTQPVSDAEIEALVSQPDLSTFHRVSLCGEDNFATVLALAKDSRLVLSVSVTDVMAIYNVLLLWVTGAAVIVGGLSYWLSRFIARRLTSPLRELTTVAEEFAKGNLDCSVNEGSTEELAVLTGSFNRMAQQIKQLLVDVRHKARVVEQQRADLRVARAKDDFLTNVSHELRTPLTSLVSFAELLVNYGADEDPVERGEFLQIIKQESMRLGRLVSQLFEQSKLENGLMAWRLEEMNLAEVLRSSIVSLVGPSHARTGQVTLDLPEECFYSGDEDQLRQVIANLIGNALKFSGEDYDLTIALRSQDGMHEIRVADRGPGVSDEDKAKIFGRFVQGGDGLIEKPEGTGLGLAICDTIIAFHGGTIGCEDHAGGGAVFVIELPKAGGRPIDMHDPADYEVTVEPSSAVPAAG